MRQLARTALVAVALVAATATPAAASDPVPKLKPCNAPYGVGEIWWDGRRVANLCWY